MSIPRLLTALFVTAALLVPAPIALGQEEEEEEEAPRGIVFLNAVSTPFNYVPDSSTAQSIAICQGTRVESYGMVVDAPSATADAKAYASASEGAGSCSTRFDFPITSATVVEGTATLSTWSACDVASVNYSGFSARLSKVSGGVATALNSADGESSGTPDTCDSTVVPVKFDIALSAAAGVRTFKEGDILRLSVWAWYPNPSPAYAKNLHYLVGSKTHPSSLELAGLPMPGGAGDFNLSLTTPEPMKEAAPGTSAVFPLTLQNDGASAVDAILNSTGDATVEFEGGAAHMIPASAGKVLNASVQVPASASPGDAIEIEILAEVGGVVAANLTVMVHVVEGTSSTSTPGPNSTSSSSASANDTGGAKSGDGGGSPGPGVGLLVMGIVAAAVALRRRIR